MVDIFPGYSGAMKKLQDERDALARKCEAQRGLLIDTVGNLQRMADDEFEDCDQDRLSAVIERIQAQLSQGGEG